MRRCPWFRTAPLGRLPARAGCKRLGYAKADSYPPPAAIDRAAELHAAIDCAAVNCVHVVERPEPAYTRSHVAKLRQG